MMRAFSFWRAVVVVALVVVALPVVGAPPAAAAGEGYTPVSPARVWDSRFGPGPVGKVGPGQTRDITVTGFGGLPSSNVTAVVVNITAVEASGGTFVTAWPTGEARPTASNLNVPGGDIRPNLVTVKVGSLGRISFYNDAGTVDLIADIAGWYGPSGTRRYNAVSPFRVYDSRFGPGPIGRLGPNQHREVLVAGFGGSPIEGVTAVALNITAVAPTAATFLTAWPANEGRPTASNLNLPPGDARPNMVVVKLADGIHGDGHGTVSIYNAVGTVDIIVDMAGYFTSSGTGFTSVSPSRVWDSRFGPGPTGSLPPAGTRDITVLGVGGVPATGVMAVVLNVTAIALGGTFITVWPTGEGRPTASNLNIPPGDTRANLVTVKVGAGGQVSFYNDTGNVDLIADVAGWYG